VTPLYPQKLALTSPTSGGRSVGIVRSRTKATEVFFMVLARVSAFRSVYFSWVYSFFFSFLFNTLIPPTLDGLISNSQLIVMSRSSTKQAAFHITFVGVIRIIQFYLEYL